MSTKQTRQSYDTDDRLLCLIEKITGGDLDNSNGHPEYSDDPAVQLWADGGRDAELLDVLNRLYFPMGDDDEIVWGASGTWAVVLDGRWVLAQ